MMKINKIFDHQTKNINSAALILSFTSLVSAILGLIRDRLLAGRFGAGNELDIYYTSFKIPDFLTMVLIMGSVSAAIIPVFTSYLVRSKKDAWKFLANILNIFLFLLSIISLILIIFTPQLIKIIAPGFVGPKRELTILLTRIMFLSPFLIGIGNILSSVLCVFRRFLVASLTPIVYNLGIIFGILFLVPKFGLIGLSLGVVLGGIFYLLIQLPALFQLGFSFQKILDFKEENVKKVIKLAIPRSIGLAATQINILVVTKAASLLPSGSIAIFNLAENLSRPAVNLLGSSFASALFPALSLSFSKGKNEKILKLFNQSLAKILFIIFILTILIFSLRNFIVKIIFETGIFKVSDVQLTAACLGIFALSLFAQNLNILFAQTFYALNNTKIPALCAIFGMTFNIVFYFIFIKTLPPENFLSSFLIKILKVSEIKNTKLLLLTFGYCFASIVQFSFLYYFLKKELKNLK